MTTPQSDSRADRTRWGRARFGGGSAALLVLAGVTGAVLSSGLGALMAVLGDHERPWLMFGVVAVVVLPTACALAWAVLVDRSTVAGAVDRPGESVESAWYRRAASGAFTDLIVVMGLGAVGFTIFELAVPASLLLIALAVLAMADLGLRYWVAARTER